MPSSFMQTSNPAWNPTSTPLKSHSSLPQSSSEIQQHELKQRVGKELSNQVWQFPPERIAEMLCPSGVELPPIDDAISSLNEKLRSNPNLARLPSGGERTVYESLELILNSCIDSCVEVIEKVQKGRTPLWFDGLQFVVWDRGVSDQVDGTHKVKPDLAGLNNPPKRLRGVKLYWDLLQEDETNRRFLLPVEVKPNDVDMVKQAATYARALNSAVPFRAFELVLMYNHISDQFRFLIFHRGGLTCSEPIQLRHTTQKNKTKPPDCTDLVRMFMSILSWTKADDAGCPSFSNGKQFLLPDPLHPATLTRFATDAVLYRKPGVRSRNTWVARLTTHAGEAAHAAKTVDPPRGRSSNPGSSRSNPPRKSTLAKVPAYNKPAGSSSEHTDKPKTLKRKQPGDLGLVNQYHSQLYEPLTVAWNALANAVPKAEDQPSSVILKASWQVEQRKAIEADVFKELDGAFGTAKYWYCVQPLHAGGREPVSNITFLPEDKEINSRFWDVLSKETPKTAERRYLVITLLATEGKQFTHVKTAKDLVDCLMHSVLGWWSVYQAGFLHRDVSIGNILMAKEPFESQKKFSFDVEEVLRKTASKSSEAAHSSGNDNPVAQKKDKLIKRIMADAKSVEELILRSGLSRNSTQAFIMDFDLGASWVGYFTADHSAGSISGTHPFMSVPSAEALKRGRPYLQSPVDDIESFYWVTLYSIVQNSTSPRSELDNELQDTFNTEGRSEALQIFANAKSDMGYCQLTRILSASRLLKKLEGMNEALRDQWNEDRAEVVAPNMHDIRAWELCYHAGAIGGLLGILQILIDFKGKNNNKAQ